MSLFENGNIIPKTSFMSNNERSVNKNTTANGVRRLTEFIPYTFSDKPRFIKEHFKPIDVAWVCVSPMDENGNFSLGISNDHTSAGLEVAKHVVVDVNPNMPYVKFGNKNLINIRDVDFVIESNNEILEIEPTAHSENDDKIGQFIADMIENGSTIQMGVGALPNAIATKLVNKKDLGIHTEVFTTGMYDLVKQGVVTNKLKSINRGKSVFTFVLGNKELYKWLDHNDDVASFNVDYVNDAHVISQNDKMVSINSTIEIDLYGQCNSEMINWQQYSSAGGQLDFVRGAYHSKGGKSFIALHSTTKNDSVSKIVPKLSGVVTTPRHDVQYVVTEYGVINLKGKTDVERTKLLISIAHPKFRDHLTDEAKKLNLI